MEKIVFDDISTRDWNALNLEILDNALFTGDRSWFFSNLSSPYNRIYLVIDGDAYIENEQGRLPLRPGYMYLIPATSRYTYVCTDRIHKFFFHFTLELFPGIDLFSNIKMAQELTYSPILLSEILAESKTKSLSGLLHLKAIFWKIIYDFFAQAANTSSYMDLYKGFRHQQHVLDYLSSHLHAGLRIRDVSDVFGIPSHQLSRSFKNDTGYGLKEYIEHLLLKEAQRLLLYSDLSISQISEKLGFSDPFYFSRFFKKYEQLSPREYRKPGF